MSVIDLLLGKPLETSDERAEQIGAAAGIRIFGLDALSSAAYGQELDLRVGFGLSSAAVDHFIRVGYSLVNMPSR